MSQPLALIDMDGTLAAFDPAMRWELTRLNDPSMLPPDAFDYDAEDKYPHIAAQRALIKGKLGFWRGLHELPLGFKIAAALKLVGFKLHVCTRASKKYPQCWAEKVEWCRAAGAWVEEELILGGAGITITTDKTIVHGDVLVDDWPPYFTK